MSSTTTRQSTRSGIAAFGVGVVPNYGFTIAKKHGNVRGRNLWQTIIRVLRQQERSGTAMNVTFDGLDELQSTLEKIQSQVPKNIAQAYEEVGNGAKDFMDGRTPVDTGRLRSGNTLETTENGFTLSNEVPYAIYVEYGTRKMAAQPFLTPTVEHAQEELATKLPEALTSF